MDGDRLWSVLFAGATAILMLGILLLRPSATPLWALLTFPAIGASLAHMASRTTPNRRQILWLETSTIAAACVVLLVLMVNGFLIDLLFGAVGAGAASDRTGVLLMVVLAGGAALLWWALERRLKRLGETLTGNRTVSVTTQESADFRDALYDLDERRAG